jgi:hypothetical protein
MPNNIILGNTYSLDRCFAGGLTIYPWKHASTVPQHRRAVCVLDNTSVAICQLHVSTLELRRIALEPIVPANTSVVIHSGTSPDSQHQAFLRHLSTCLTISPWKYVSTSALISCLIISP